MNVLYSQFNKLNEHLKSANDHVRRRNITKDRIIQLNRTVFYTQGVIMDKIQNLQTHSRHRRGLINGLGDIIKAITGNLNADDGIQFHKEISRLSSELSSQASINQQLITNFNKTTQDIQYNMVQIRRKLFNITDGGQDIIRIIEVVLQDLETVYTLLLIKIQEIETSLTFCRLGILHPSIITTKQFSLEIKKLKDKLYPNVVDRDILDLEGLSKVNCIMDNDQILYTLVIPILNVEEFELYFMYSVPTKTQSGYITIAPSNRFILKSKFNRSLPLNSICTKGHRYYCLLDKITATPHTCEEEILIHGTTNTCLHIQLKLDHNVIEYVPEMNSYLAIFLEPTPVIVQAATNRQTRYLQGIYLLPSGNETRYIYENKELLFPTTSHGKPHFLENIHWKDIDAIQPESSLVLKTLKFRDITTHIGLINPVISTQDQPNWGAPIIIGLVLGALFIISASLWIVNRVRQGTPAPPPERSALERSTLQRPGDAAF